MANIVSNKTLYSWDFYSQDDQPVTSSNNITISTTQLINNVRDLDTFIVIGGLGSNYDKNESILELLRTLHFRGVLIGSASTGSVFLAQAGLLNNRHCTTHWHQKEHLQENCPEVQVTGELYEIDHEIMTSSGGFSVLDMILQRIEATRGHALAHAVSIECIHPAMMSGHEKQRTRLQLRSHTQHPLLLKALELMRANTENVVSCAEICETVGLSIRQMERLFKDCLNICPATYYTKIRLMKAHCLLQQTVLPISQVSKECGFSSVSYFSHCYRKHYGYSPKEGRRSLI
ncbi:UNVERIFIED_CONTAM: hypothetical protein GTU68_052129 [Idotea baltica]|nr:hypothetical protein [Idotea baltica]